MPNDDNNIDEYHDDHDYDHRRPLSVGQSVCLFVCPSVCLSL